VRNRAAWYFAVLIGAAAVCSSCRQTSVTAGLWFDPNACVIPAEARAAFPELTGEEIAAIHQVSKAEVDQAFSGLRLHVTDDQQAFWRVQVVSSLPPRSNQSLPKAGQSLALGMLGGTGAVGCDLVALNAIRYAPPGASRQTIVEGIGRGVGRVAVHELAHQILGVTDLHDSDQDSYEYASPDRPSQYYGTLHWTTAWPLLLEKLGT
jgi:hypothetical protein